MFFFFFSSRRRHTRFSRDWSSDVCSSDLELLGYIRGYDNAADFRALGTPTWDANANQNEAWLANPHRKGTDDMGRVYGVQGRARSEERRVGKECRARGAQTA